MKTTQQQALSSDANISQSGDVPFSKRTAGSIKLKVSFAKEPYKTDDILQKRPMISVCTDSGSITREAEEGAECILRVERGATFGSIFRGGGHCNTLQHTATHCNTLQHNATHCNTMQHTATHCNTLQHTATQCNTLQHTATHCNTMQHNGECDQQRCYT